MATERKKRTDIVAAAMRHKSITLLLVLILMASGVVSLIHIPKDEFPNFTMPLGLVVGVYPGASALEVERQLARPLEEFLWTFKEIKKGILIGLILAIITIGAVSIMGSGHFAA